MALTGLALTGDSANAFHGAINLLDGRVYRHHPVMLQVKETAHPSEYDYLVELNGLRVPAGWDCNIFNKGSKAWGLFWYFNGTSAPHTESDSTCSDERLCHTYERAAGMPAKRHHTVTSASSHTQT